MISDGLVASVEEFSGGRPMRDRFIVVSERAIGQRVIGYMGGKPAISPDIMCEVSMLALTDLIDEHGPDAAGLQTSDR